VTTINNNNNTKTTNKIKKHFRNSSQTKPFTYGLIPHHKTQLHPRELSPRRPRLPLPRLILRGQPVLVVQTKPLQPQRPIRHKTPLPQRPHLMPRQLAPCPRSRPEARENRLQRPREQLHNPRVAGLQLGHNHAERQPHQPPLNHDPVRRTLGTMAGQRLFIQPTLQSV